MLLHVGDVVVDDEGGNFVASFFRMQSTAEVQSVDEMVRKARVSLRVSELYSIVEERHVEGRIVRHDHGCVRTPACKLIHDFTHIRFAEQHAIVDSRQTSDS